VRNGIPLPAATVEEYEIDLSLTVTESEIPRETRRYARWNWIDAIIGDVLAPIDFGRAKNASHSVKSFFGVLAHSALQDISVQSVADTLPSGCSELGRKNITPVLQSLSKDTVQNQFEAVHEQLYKIAEQKGIFADDHTVAFDPTSVASPAESEQTVQIGSGDFWFYPTMAVVDSEARLILSLRHIKRKEWEIDKLEHAVREMSANIDIKRFYLDGTFHSAQGIRVARGITTDYWAIRCNPGRLADDEKPEAVNCVPANCGEYTYQQGVSVKGKTTNAVWYKIETSDGPKLVGYLTDLSEKQVRQWEQDTDADTLHERYQSRCAIETTFGQLKHPFRPALNSDDVAVELFCMHTAVLFYNIYILINRHFSPKLLLRLDQIPEGVLTAIRDVCLDCGQNPLVEN
jgi:hypothetical protein